MTQKENNRLVLTIIFSISGAITLFLFWLIYFKGPSPEFSETVSKLPALNATFNTLSAICLVLGFRAIKRGAQDTHMRFMLSAIVFSALFLISYVIYHNFTGHTVFPGTGLVKGIYLFILFSHIVLSVVMLPLILYTLYLALTKNFAKHPRFARWTFPIWMYVSVTGVVIFAMLRAYTS